MSNTQEIREGIDDRLATIAGLRHNPYPPAVLNPPHAYVIRRSTTFDVTTDGEDDLTFAVTMLVAYADPRAAQLELDPYLARDGAKSIKAAIDADSELGGVVDWCRVAIVEDDRIIEQKDGTQYLAADLVIEVG